MSDILIKAEGVSKKFCRSLKRSMVYGMQDIAKNMLGMSPMSDKLKPSEFWALDDISFELRRGECLGLIGPNGSGKSTLLKIINGIITQDKGRIELKGKSAALVEIGAGFHPLLTGRENVYVNGAILGFSKKEIEQKFDEIVAFSELEKFIDTPVKYYSSGMYIRLGFAIAAQMSPDILLIDEVLAVGDIGFRAKCYSMLNERLQSSAVVMVSHSMPEIARLCSKILVLAEGTCRYLADNVTSGIDLYYGLHKSPPGLTLKTPEAEFLEISIQSDMINNVPTICFQDELIVHLIATVSARIKKPIFHMAILNQALHNICHSSSAYSQSDINNQNGIITLRVKLPSIYLRPGIYYLDFAVTDNNNVKILARTHLCHKIQVTGDISGYGAMLVPAEWKTN